MTPATYTDQLRAILSGLHIDTERQQITIVADGAQTPYQPDTIRQTLAELLYQRFYCAAETPIVPATSDDSLLNELSRHNHSRERFDTAWTADAVDMAGLVYATKGNHRRMVYAGEFVYEQAKRGPVGPGDALRLLMYHEQRDAQSGFYFAFGQTPGDDDTTLQTRLYFHTTPEGSCRLLAWVTQTLNDYHIPFQFKCLNHPDLYGRPDSAVLYVQKPYVNLVMTLLADALPDLDAYLQPAVPPFTRLVAPGVAFAESPPNPNESFGTSRCGLLAQAIANAVADGQAADQYEPAIRALFTQIGLSLDRPYCNPDSHYPYQFN